MIIRRLCFIVVLALLLCFFGSRSLLAAKAFAIVDAQTGYVLDEQDAKAKRQIGSLTKVATAMVVLDWAEKKSGDLNQIRAIPPEAFVGTGENLIGFQPGGTISLRDLLYAALVQSDNIAAYTLASHVGTALQSIVPVTSGSQGPVDVFVGQMNALAKTLNMERTRFVNPHGIDEKARTLPYSTAADLVRLTRYAINKAGFRFYVSQKERQITFNRGGKKLGYILRNTNELLGVSGVDGVKTGRTARAGDCLILSAGREPQIIQDGPKTAVIPRHLIIVILGSTERFGEGAQLLSRGWQLYDQWAAAGRMVSPKRFFDLFVTLMMKPRIGVLTSGGDCPGLNAVIRGVVLAADKLGWEVLGFLDGFEGLVPPGKHIILDRRRIAGIMPRGGTIIGTTNRGHFVAKVGAGDRVVVAEDAIANACEMLKEVRVGALIVIGGDGSMVTALQFQDAGINCIGVPKTIDNDLEATAMTFGFDSAVAAVMDALDRLHTTATSHKRVMVLEVMGRHAGWIALHGGIAGGAHIILIPEIPFDYDKIAAAINARADRGNPSAIVVVAEGACPRDGQVVMRPNPQGEYRLGGLGGVVADEIAARTGKETRCTVLGHLQRGGTPTALDRILGTRFGVKAVKLIQEEQFGSMVSYQNYQVRYVSIAETVNRLKLVPPDGQVVQTARDVEISFGD